VDGFVLSRIDGTLGARDVVSLSPLPAEEVERSLFGLLCTGIICHVGDRRLTRPLARASQSRAEHDTAELPAVAPDAGGASRPAVPQAPDGVPETPPDVDEVRRLILQMRLALAHRDHYGVLGLGRQATVAEIERAHRGLVLFLNAETCDRPGLEDLQPQRQDLLARVEEAFQVLRDPGRRAAYHRQLAQRHTDGGGTREP
jgi:hypothetical protein